MTSKERDVLPSEYGILMDDYEEYQLFRLHIQNIIESALKSCPIGSHKKQAKHVADYIFSVGDKSFDNH